MSQQDSVLGAPEAKRVARKQERRNMREEIYSFSMSERGRFVHVRPMSAESQFGGGVTVCFVPPKLPSHLVEISVAWCHPNDAYTKLDGQYEAMHNWFARNRIHMRLPSKHNVAFELERMFQNILDS